MFSQSWFEDLAKPNFETYIKPELQNRTVNCLEIGCFQGNCTLFLFENILNDKSRVTVLDPFDSTTTHDAWKDIKNTFKFNLERYLNRIDIVEGLSQRELHNLKRNSYDFIYVDGDHNSIAVLTDGLLSWELLKSGGILAFDDFTWTGAHPDLLNIGNPYCGISHFLHVFEGKYDFICKNYQVIIRKH